MYAGSQLLINTQVDLGNSIVQVLVHCSYNFGQRILRALSKAIVWSTDILSSHN